MTQAGEAPSIDVIGVDDSGPDCLTDRERSLVYGADLLCGGDRHLALFPSCSADRFRIGADLEGLYARLAKCETGPAVVLASGDPCYFGIGPLLVSRFGAERVKIHPRPSSVSMAFSRLGLPWQDATVLSVHGRPIEDAVLPALVSTKVAILTDPVHTPSEVAASLLASGMEDCPTFVCERLGGPDERIHSHSLSGLPDKEFDPLNVLILLPSGRRSSSVGIGRPDSSFLSTRGQITKSEVRAVTVSRLEPWRATVCWDVGAGCGSVSIESASLMRDPCVYAVEREPEQADLIRHNARSHRAAGIQIIEGAAPAALETLPAPDCVFVGGGGPSLMPILQVVSERLTAGGRIVANFALIERLAVWQQFASLIGWQSELSQIAVSRGEPLGSGTHLAPLAPVFVTRVTKPERDR
jgi:precorrin-6Y C5,15-methyltransferase (decarboxylating)